MVHPACHAGPLDRSSVYVEVIRDACNVAAIRERVARKHLLLVQHIASVVEEEGLRLNRPPRIETTAHTRLRLPHLEIRGLVERRPLLRIGDVLARHGQRRERTATSHDGQQRAALDQAAANADCSGADEERGTDRQPGGSHGARLAHLVDERRLWRGQRNAEHGDDQRHLGRSLVAPLGHSASLPLGSSLKLRRVFGTFGLITVLW